MLGEFRHANPRRKTSSPPFSLDVPPFFTVLRRSLLIFHHSSLMLHHTPSFSLDVPPFSLDAPPFSLDVEAARFLDLFAACLSHNSVFSGSLRKLTSTERSSALGYLPSIAELKSGANFFNYSPSLVSSGLSELPKCRLIEEKSIEKPVKGAQNNYELLLMPHWFSYVGSLKLYQPLAGILRFVGLSLVSWYDRHGSGQLLRQASTAACMLNEIIFGISERASNDVASIFHNCAFHTSFWKMPKDKGVRSYLVECIGGILHEYLAAEVWNVPIDRGTADL
ncbi:hypothetical protein DEO72_LG4g72 [Vigna unguiculata]|uniref:Uncharacterized protein n=1 Tax=Vigna unguiculata TaxID=3917 RepID=A0A4D6LM69_VIGUN|nr:hypothetical protein DEO72_LG4g72 [Vigna unguiculata]